MISAAVPPHVATAAVLMMAALMTLVIGLVRRKAAFLPGLPGVLFVLAASAAFLPRSIASIPTDLDRLPAAIAVVALLLYVALDDREPLEPGRGHHAPSPNARIYLGAALGVAALQLFYKLGTYAGSLLTWETTTIGFTDAFLAGQSVLAYTARRFLWDCGVLSMGDTSLFYGAPTYALFHVAGFSPWTLRAAAAIATLLSILVIYALAGRIFGPLVGAAAACLLALNSGVLFYGRYGSSPAGTLLAVSLAVWCTWVFLDRDRSAWWMGPICAAALYLATLQYSPARIVVLILLGFIPIVLLCQWRRLWWQRLVGFAFIVAISAGVWHVQGRFDTQVSFLSGRGEQILNCLPSGWCIHQTLGREIAPDALTPFDEIELVYRWLQTTVPQYLALMAPAIESEPLSDGGVGGLPRLYYAPLVLFIAWGLVHSLRRWRAWPHACLLLWVSAGSVPLLFTNRVDAHRIMLFVLPLSLWAALGIWEAARLMSYATVPLAVQHVFAAALGLTLVYSDVMLLHNTPNPSPIAAESLAAEVARVPGPVIAGAIMDHRQLGWLQLALLERARRDPYRWAVLLNGDQAQALRDTPGQPDEARLQALQNTTQIATVILAPANSFRAVAAALQVRGVRVAQEGPAFFPVLRMDAGAGVTGVADTEIHLLPTVAPSPTLTPTPSADGPPVSPVLRERNGTFE